jgi:hypothetical protein
MSFTDSLRETNISSQIEEILDLWQKEGNIRIKGSDSNRSKVDPGQISNG